MSNTINNSLSYIKYFLPKGNYTEDCEQATRFSTLTGVIVLDFVTIICNIFALVVGFIITKSIIRKAIFHVHLQILFTNISLALAFRAILTTFRTMSNLYYLSVLWFTKSNCTILWSLYSCTVVESLCSLPFETLSYAYTAIIIEQIFALNLSQTYEKRRYIKTVFLLAGITWVKPIIDFINKIEPSDKANNVILYCSSITTYATEYSSKFSPLELLYVILIIFCLIFAPILLIFGKRKKRNFSSRSTHSLSNRFQILENIRTSRIVLKNVLLYCACQILSIAGTYAVMYSKNLSAETVVIAKELASFSFLIYTYGFLIFFVITVPAIAKQFGICREYAKPRVSSLGTTDDYFDIYAKSW